MSCEVFPVVVQFHPSPPHKTYLLLTHKSSIIALFKDPGLLNVVHFPFPVLELLYLCFSSHEHRAASE